MGYNPLPPPGNASCTNSLPVTLAYDQPAISVSGIFWQATQPVSGNVSVSNLPATQPVSGTVTANAGTGTFTVDGSGHTQPVSGTFWQATQPVSGTFWQATQPVSAVSLPLPVGAATESTLGGVKAGTDRIPAQGQAAMVASLPVVLANNQSAILTTPTETRPTSTVMRVDLLSVDDFTRVLTLLAANVSRRGVTIANRTDAAFPIKEGTGASLTSYTDILGPGEDYVLDYPASTSALTAFLAQVPGGALYVTERA